MSGKKVWVAGHRGMVGSAVMRRLSDEGCALLTVDRSQVDLKRQSEVEGWMASARPDVVIIAAATVGGIHANSTRPAEFIHDNLMIANNVIDTAHRNDVEKLLYLGSSCIYPRLSPQPIPEDALLTGPLEPTNQWYAVAKIAGIKLCQAYRAQYGRDYISAMPTNLYGPGDNFDLMSSHVLPAMMAKIHAAKVARQDSVTIWGSGKPLREFMYVEDLADALVFLLKTYSGEAHVNVGVGEDVSISQAAATLAKVVGFQGRFVHDLDKPDGMPRKLMDSTRLLSMGWKPRTSLEEGLSKTYQWFLEQDTLRKKRG
ncbi:MAG: GDP-L-fucose synthase [Rhodospirillum sp.]|nr:GDP-L-fucose synthase [Rhodospirillum sp.]MCF8487752.1 GDP-L-fucose synthase [Rhodospirillum sp.]MCF8502820.1 GDP-L-fucose synthase [Rhodospirillum sp.]